MAEVVCDKNGDYVFIRDVTKNDGPFFCPYNKCRMLIREPRERIRHFAHYPRSSCDFSGESQEHLDGKVKICLHRNLDPKKCKEYRCTYGNNFRIADVYDNNGRLVFEIQVSIKEVTEAQKRQVFWRKLGCQVVWVWSTKTFLRTEIPDMYEEYRLNNTVIWNLRYNMKWKQGKKGCFAYFMSPYAFMRLHFSNAEREKELTEWGGSYTYNLKSTFVLESVDILEQYSDIKPYGIKIKGDFCYDDHSLSYKLNKYDRSAIKRILGT